MNEPEMSFVCRRAEYTRNVIVVKIREPIPDDEVVEFATKATGESNCFGSFIRRYGDEVEVHFYND